MVAKFKVYSDSISDTDFIPKKYTSDGEDVSPPIKWDSAPDETKSFALIVDDPDAPNGTFTHWLVKDIPKNMREIKEGSNPGVEVESSWKVKRWRGPKPPSGIHRYFFKLYALNTEKIKADNLNDFYEEVRDHKIAEASFMGKYAAKH